MDSPVRTRFCLVSDSPLHIDAARIALFNWMLARQAGGQFLLRVDNIDRAIGAVDATGQILEDLRWLGLDWDEAPDVDGLREPCLQGQPAEVYEPYYRILLESGCAYHTFDTPAELEQMRQQALVAWRPFRYPRPRELPDADDVLKARQQGRPVVLRFKMPDRDITVEDLVLGSVSLPADELDDYVIRGVDGRPTWLFTTVIDDQRMGITHVIRGQEHLPYAHRHVALQEALGFRQPAYAHLPLILDPDGSVLSRHDKERDLRADRAPRPTDLRDFRAAGYLPEVLMGFLASVGVSGERQGRGLSREELIRSLDIQRISRAAARFDREGLLSWNAQAIAEAGQERLLAGLRDYLSVKDTPLKAAQDGDLRSLLRLGVAFRIFNELDQKASWLFVADEQVVYDDRGRQESASQGIAERVGDPGGGPIGTGGLAVLECRGRRSMDFRVLPPEAMEPIQGDSADPRSPQRQDRKPADRWRA